MHADVVLAEREDFRGRVDGLSPVWVDGVE
jgi:hypothetical protein